MTARVVSLRSKEASDARVEGTPTKRLALVAELSASLWTQTGREFPQYSRSTMPVKLLTRTATPATPRL
jgi:hypothetical protein